MRSLLYRSGFDSSTPSFMMHCCKKSDGIEKEDVEMIDMTSYMDALFTNRPRIRIIILCRYLCMNYVVNVLLENSVSCHFLLAFRNN